jgi:hypothetical protein
VTVSYCKMIWSMTFGDEIPVGTWIGSQVEGRVGRGFPPRKIVGRAFLDGQKPFNPFHDVDGWREDIDNWALEGIVRQSL